MIEKVGRYRILEQAGTGGMSTVYRAVDEILGRVVALKLLPDDLSANEMFLARFKREARLVARLEHPNIVPLYDYGTHETGQPYLVMRYLGGDSLSKRLKSMQYVGSENDLWTVLHQVGSGLTAAHTEGIIHRDIKPSNIMFDDHGIAFITDFGIAKQTEQTSQRITPARTVLGTANYMSPEQCSASESLSQASDQYSLAIIVFEALTGMLPFEGDTLQVMHKHIHDPAPIDYLRQYSGDVVQVIGKALSKEPKDRYASVDAFIKALTSKRLSNKEPNHLVSLHKPSRQINGSDVLVKKQPDALSKNYAKAVKAFNEKSYTEAIRLFDRVIRQDPTFKDSSTLYRRAKKLHERTIRATQSRSSASKSVSKRTNYGRKRETIPPPHPPSKIVKKRSPWFVPLIVAGIVTFSISLLFLLPYILPLIGFEPNGPAEVSAVNEVNLVESVNNREEEPVIVKLGAATDASAYGEGVVTLDINADVIYKDVASMRLKKGKLVIQTSDSPIMVESKWGDHALIGPNSQAGIRFDDSDVFSLHCFMGSCSLSGSVDGIQNLKGGQKGSVSVSGRVSGVAGKAQNELFVFAKDVATPTPVAIPTPSSIPIAPPLPTVTTVPVATGAPTAGNGSQDDFEEPVSDPRDADGDGVLHDPANGLYDLCPDELGYAHSCGCPTKPPSCGGRD